MDQTHQRYKKKRWRRENYGRVRKIGPARNRTWDSCVISTALYLLSYRPFFFDVCTNKKMGIKEHFFIFAVVLGSLFEFEGNDHPHGYRKFIFPLRIRRKRNQVLVPHVGISREVRSHPTMDTRRDNHHQKK